MVKKILIIAPNVFNIISPLQNALVSSGFVVDYYDDRFGQSFYKSVFLRFSRSIYFALFGNKIRDILKGVSNDYDCILVINGEALSTEMLLDLSKKCKQFVFYSWDSVANKAYLESIYKTKCSPFSKIFSFDIEDCNTYDISYCPLFAETLEANLENCSVPIDNFFVGTMHSDRLVFIIDFLNTKKNECENNLIMLFTKNYFIYVTEFMRNLRYYRYFLKYVKIGSMDPQIFKTKMMMAGTVLDYAHPKQSGLTHRSVMALQNNKKVISNNPHLPNAVSMPPSRGKLYTGKKGNMESFDIATWLKKILGESG